VWTSQLELLREEQQRQQ
jgi:hypothetical protein